MSCWVLLRVWEPNLFEQSELDWCLPLKEQMSHFCTLSDQPVTFNARADWSLSGTADKISGTKLACHSRRSNSRLRRELREWWKNHNLFAPSAESEHLEQVTSQTFLSEKTISQAPDRLLVCYLANADFFPVVATSAFAKYCYILQKYGYKKIFIDYWMEIVDMCVIDRYPEAKYEFAILTYRVLKWWRHKN